VLADGAFQTFSLAYTARVLERLHRHHEGRRVPRIVFTKGGGPWLEHIGALPTDVVGLDWTVSMATARRRVGPDVALQGNLDPCVLFAPPEQIRHEVSLVLRSAAQGHRGDGHIFNLGHGISQHTPPESVGALVDAVHELSRAFRTAHDA